MPQRVGRGAACRPAGPLVVSATRPGGFVGARDPVAGAGSAAIIQPMDLALEQGRAAYQLGRWVDAYNALSTEDAESPLGAGDLELLARSAYMLGLDDEYGRNLERAHHAHVEAGNVEPAIRCAWWIGHNLVFRGEVARASGWFGRGRRLLERLESESVEHGYMLIPDWLDAMGRGDLEAGLAIAVRAAAIGERFDDADLVWLARDDQGRALVKLGRLDEGLRLVDEVLVAALAGELSPIVTGIVYCNTIAFCRDAYAVRHAREWTEALSRWCDAQAGMVAHMGLCLLHRAEIMQLRGAWDEALVEVGRAAERYTRGVLNQIACGQAHYRRGELHRLRGEIADAETAYAEASRCGFEPQPGLALLRLAQGRDEAAAAAMRRAVAEVTHPLERVGLLPAYVEVMIATNELERARAAAAELEEIAAGHKSDAIAAAAAQARGAVSLAQGDHTSALVALRSALQGWIALDAPYEVACVRLLMGLVRQALEDEDGARLELDAAREAFVQLGAVPEIARVAALTPGQATLDTGGLTGREVEVLRLVATGKTNREIAAVLTVSEHTVARHLQNIFVKLGVSTRTAASTYAFEHDLI
jgi:DNA-binding NarL/FixJ family response regulator